MKLPLRPLLAGLGLVLAPVAYSIAADSPAPTATAPTTALGIPATDAGLPGAGPIRRYEWFQKLWVDRRTEWAAHVQDDQGALVFLGDSITQYWGDLPSLFPGIKIANRGISGDTTRGVLIRMQQDVIALHPKGVVLLIGTNDLEEWASPEIIAGNLKLIIAALRDYNPQMPVVLCEVMPSSLQKKRPVDLIKKVNELYLAAVADEPQVTVLDTWSLFATPTGDAPAELFPDLLHPNAAGYAKWAAALRPILETVGLVPAWADNSAPEAGFTPLFNGRDLSGWHYRDGAALDQKTATDDGRYEAVNGRVVVTVSHRARDYKTLWTTQTFPHDFVLKLEFRASPNADSGVFVREPQVQCRDYWITGPFNTLKSYHPLDWNEMVVTVRGQLAHITVNGETIIDAMPLPADGPIGLESDHGQMEYRRIRIQEAK